MSGVSIHPLLGIGEITTGTDLGSVLVAAIARAELTLQDGDVLVVSSKVVSKASGLRLPDADKQQVVLAHSRRVVTEREVGGGITRVVEADAGPVMAAAGIDASNTGPEAGLLLLPSDPDEAAAQLLTSVLSAAPGSGTARIALVLSDTAGRPWRAGQTDFALGSSGLRVLDDRRGGRDADGRDLAVTAAAVADEIAAAADLVKGKDAGVPAALVRGLPQTWLTPEAGGARDLVRAGPENWFAFGQAEAVRSALGVTPGSDLAGRVGYPGAGPGPVEDRLRRAIRLALADPDAPLPPSNTGVAPVTDQPEVARTQVRTHTDPEGRLVLTVLDSGDPYQAGRLVARLEVALHSEALAGPLTHGVPSPVQVRVQAADGAPEPSADR